MAEIETVILSKGDEKIRVNASDAKKFAKDGWKAPKAASKKKPDAKDEE